MSSTYIKKIEGRKKQNKLFNNLFEKARSINSPETEKKKKIN